MQADKWPLELFVNIRPIFSLPTARFEHAMPKYIQLKYWLYAKFIGNSLN